MWYWIADNIKLYSFICRYSFKLLYGTDYRRIFTLYDFKYLYSPHIFNFLQSNAWTLWMGSYSILGDWRFLAQPPPFQLHEANYIFINGIQSSPSNLLLLNSNGLLCCCSLYSIFSIRNLGMDFGSAKLMLLSKIAR